VPGGRLAPRGVDGTEIRLTTTKRKTVQRPIKEKREADTQATNARINKRKILRGPNSRSITTTKQEVEIGEKAKVAANWMGKRYAGHFFCFGTGLAA